MEHSPAYKNEKEAFEYLDNKYNTGVPDDVKKSWAIIEKYAECRGIYEGDSGEFHNEADTNQALMDLKESEKQIIDWFADKFGWRPSIALEYYIQGGSIGTFWKFEKE